MKMNDRVNPKMRKRSNLFSESRKVAVSLMSVLLVFIFVNTFFYPSVYSNSASLHPNHINFRQSFDFRANLPKPKVYMYLLPENFTNGVINQHMPESYILSDLTRPGNERVGSPIVRVFNPAEADLFFVSGFSSGHSDVEMQESLMGWLESQEWWMRNNGRDHVIVVGDPNAFKRVMDRVKNAVLLLTGFGRLRVDQGSLVKDVIVPCAYRTNAYEGEVGVENRNTLLFFRGNQNRKDGGQVRDKVLKLLDNEDDVVIKHGSQSELNRRAAKQGIHTSKFCLHLTGDTISVYKLFDSIASLCVPVIVSDGIELPFEDVIDYRKFSIFLRTDAALKPGVVVKKLRKVKPGKILKYQKAMKEVRRYFNYTHPNGSVNEIWRQVTQKIPLIKLMINREKRMIKREVNEPQCSCLCSNRTSIIDGGL